MQNTCKELERIKAPEKELLDCFLNRYIIFQTYVDYISIKDQVMANGKKLNNLINKDAS